MKIVLCIDDDAERYTKMARILRELSIPVVVVRHLNDIRWYLELHEANTYEIIGICLDHDLGGGPNGDWIARNMLHEYNIPVAITSNNPIGAANIQLGLNEYEVPCTRRAARNDRQWATDIIEWFDENQKSTT